MDRIDSTKTEKVCIDMPANLARILRADAVLHGITFEESILGSLHSIVISWLECGWGDDVLRASYKCKDINKQEVRAE